MKLNNGILNKRVVKGEFMKENITSFVISIILFILTTFYHSVINFWLAALIIVIWIMVEIIRKPTKKNIITYLLISSVSIVLFLIFR